MYVACVQRGSIKNFKNRVNNINKNQKDSIFKEYLSGEYFMSDVKTYSKLDEKSYKSIYAHGSLKISTNLSDEIDLIFCFLFFSSTSVIAFIHHVIIYNIK